MIMTSYTEGMAADPPTAVRTGRDSGLVTRRKTPSDKVHAQARMSPGPKKARSKTWRIKANDLSEPLLARDEDTQAKARRPGARPRSTTSQRTKRAVIPEYDSKGFKVVPYHHELSEDDLWAGKDELVPVVGGRLFTTTSGPTFSQKKRARSPSPPPIRRPSVGVVGSINSTDEDTPSPRPPTLCNRVSGISYAVVAQGSEAVGWALVKAAQARCDIKSRLVQDLCPTRPLAQCVAPGSHKLVDTNGGEYGCTINKSNRKLRPAEFATYVLPKLDVLDAGDGVRDPDVEGFLLDGSLRMETGKGYCVKLPTCVVEQSVAWLAGKARTLPVQRLLYVKVAELIRDLDITPTENAVCAWFAPLVAWSQTESIHIEHGYYMRRMFMGRATYVRIASLAAVAAGMLPTAAAATVAGAGAAVAAPFAVAGVTAAAMAISVYAAWSAGYLKPSLGQRFNPQLWTVNSTAVAPADHKDGAKMVMKGGSDKPEPHDQVKPALTPIGISHPNMVPIALATNAANEKLAVEARVLAKTPVPDPEIMADFVAWTKRNVYSILGNASGRPFRIQPLDFDEWLKGCNCNTATKELYARVKADLTLAGITHDSALDAKTLHRYTLRKSFVKLETTLHRKAQKAPRLIQGAQPEMTVLTGPWFVAFQGWLKRRLSPAKSKLVYGPGLDQRAAAQFVGDLAGRAAITEDDVSTYDASISRPLGELEIWICKQFGIPRAPTDLYTTNLSTHGYTRHGVYYEVDGTRKSGDTGTSVLNTLLNLLMHAYIYCTFRSKPVTWEQARDFFFCLATGDDDVLGDAAYADVDWAAGMRALGFESKPIRRNHPSEVEFCSTILLPVTYPDGPGWAFVPKLGRMISKACVTLRCKRDSDRIAILRGTALSLLACTSGSPPHRAYVRRVLELTAGVTPIMPYDEPWKFSSTSSGIDNPETHAALEKRYGWTPELQVDWERELASVNQACAFEDLPICEAFQVKDSDEPTTLFSSSSHTGPKPVTFADIEEIKRKISAEPEPFDDDELPPSPPLSLSSGLDSEVDEKFDTGYRQQHHMRVGNTVVTYIADGSTYAEIFAKPYLNMRFLVGQREVSPVQVAAHDFEVVPKALGGAASAITTATITMALTRIVAGVAAHAAECVECTDSIMELLALRNSAQEDACFNVVKAPTATQSGPTCSTQLFCAFQGKTRLFDGAGVHSKTFSAVFADLTGIGPDKHSMLILTVPGQPNLGWQDAAAHSFYVNAKGCGGSGTNVSKAEKMLDRIMNYTGIDPMSRGALLNAVDPFHDHPVRSNGFPDNMSAPSVPECYKTSITVSAPTGVTGNWDMNAVIFPDLSPQLLTAWIQPTATTNLSNQCNTWINTKNITSAANFPADLASQGGAGGLTVYAGASGTFMNPQNMTAQLDVLPTRAKFGPSRVYGIGVEFINNTAPLYQQGTVTVWRQPACDPRSATTFSYTATDTAGSLPQYYYGAASTVICANPPTSVAEALVLQGSRQWHAKEGAMIVSTMNGDEVPVINGQTALTGYSEALDTVTAINTAVPVALGGVFAASTNSSTAAMGFPRTYLTPFNMSGAFFTGLSNSTTITINVRIFAEIFPSDLQNPLTPLAQPSCPYDERAIRLYSEIAKALPPGVMLCENGFGDFFSDIISKVSNFVSPIAGVVSKIAGVIPHPAAQAVARIAGTVGGVADQFRGGNGQMTPSSEQVYAQAPSAPPPPTVVYAPRPRQQLVIPATHKLKKKTKVLKPVLGTYRSKIPTIKRG